MLPASRTRGFSGSIQPRYSTVDCGRASVEPGLWCIGADVMKRGVSEVREPETRCPMPVCTFSLRVGSPTCWGGWGVWLSGAVAWGGGWRG